MHRDRRGFQLGVLLLLHELVAYGLDRVPPGTLILIIFQTVAYLGYIPILDVYQIASNCVHPRKVIYKRQFERLLLPTYMHADDMHLYYNMVSFLLKGVQLEPFFGTRYFLFLIAVFGVLINAAMVMLSFAAHSIGLGHLNLMRQCAVGFSGVIFALKVLCQEYDPMGRQYGFFRRYRSILNLSCWSELMLIQLATPNASFVGHLCGILVGLLYTRGFLKEALDVLYPGTYLSWSHRQPREERYSSRHRRPMEDDLYTGGFSGEEEYSSRYRRPMEDDLYTGGFSEQEQFLRAIRRSRWDF